MPHSPARTTGDEVYAVAMATGDTAAGILAQEARGQAEMVASDVLPTDISCGREALEALGFTFGEPVPGDPLFTAVTLPQGWSRRGSNHDMWSYIVDDLGRNRVAVFYKAAFYDRRAYATLATLASYIHEHAVNDTTPVPGGPWTLDAMRAELETMAAESDAHAKDYEDAGMPSLADRPRARGALYRSFAAKLASPA